MLQDLFGWINILKNIKHPELNWRCFSSKLKLHEFLSSGEYESAE